MVGRQARVISQAPLRESTLGARPGCHKGTPATRSHFLPQASTVQLLAVLAHHPGLGDAPTRGLGCQPRKHMSMSRGERVSLTPAQMKRACIQWGHARQGTMPEEARGITWHSLPSNGRGHQTHRKGTQPGSSIVRHIAATREMPQVGQAANYSVTRGTGAGEACMARAD